MRLVDSGVAWVLRRTSRIDYGVEYSYTLHRTGKVVRAQNWAATGSQPRSDASRTGTRSVLSVAQSAGRYSGSSGWTVTITVQPSIEYRGLRRRGMATCSPGHRETKPRASTAVNRT